MDLRNYVAENAQELEIWAEFKGVPVLLKYEDRVAFNRNVERCKKKSWKRHQQVEELSDPKVIRYLATLVRDWKGLTLGRLAELMAIDVAPDDAGKPVPCTDDNKIVLLEKAYDFDGFVMDTVTDIQAFRAEKLEAEAKNLPTSHGAASA